MLTARDTYTYNVDKNTQKTIFDFTTRKHWPFLLRVEKIFPTTLRIYFIGYLMSIGST